MVKIISNLEKRIKKVEFEGSTNDDILDEIEIVCESLNVFSFENLELEYNESKFETIYLTLDELKKEKKQLLNNHKNKKNYISKALKTLVGASIGFFGYQLLDNQIYLSESLKHIDIIAGIYTGSIVNISKTLSPTRKKIKDLEKNIAKLTILENKVLNFATDKLYENSIKPYFVSENS
jgi:MoaA/NifB/PqqE/SkfB family radical SAM enzyme